MLTALNLIGRVEAARDLPEDSYDCPGCGHSVVLKRGQVKTPHFAHSPGATCRLSASESPEHLRVKGLLAARLRANGYVVEVERDHGERRVDVRAETSAGPVAVEVQNSPISVDRIKQRNRLDRTLGYIDTLWVFTANRLSVGEELRVPEEIRYLWNATLTRVWLVDDDTLWAARLGDVVRSGEAYYAEGGELESPPDRRPRTIRDVTAVPADFRLRRIKDRYGRRRVAFVFQ